LYAALGEKERNLLEAIFPIRSCYRAPRQSKCEIFPNCPRYIPDLMGASATVPANPFVPRPGYEPPAPEWKSRDYLKDVLSKHDPHRKGEP
jgi:hypothetical protein